MVSPAWSSEWGTGLQVPTGLDRPSLPPHLLDSPAFFSLCPQRPQDTQLHLFNESKFFQTQEEAGGGQWES